MLEQRAAEIATGLFKEYYRGMARLESAYVVGREFGIGNFDSKVAYRHIAFGSPDELHRYLAELGPAFVSCSAARYTNAAARPMEAKGWMGSDLIFDLDASDLRLECAAAHGSGWVCGNCLESIRHETFRLIDEFLIPDFGFSVREISINFSGNRGYHVHVVNDDVVRLDGAARRGITDYITANGLDAEMFFNGLKARGRRLEGPMPTDYGWRGRFARGVIAALNKGEGALVELGIEKRVARRLAANSAEAVLGIATNGNWDKVNVPKKAEVWSSVLQRLAIRQADSIDRNVSNDIYHLIRLPETLHGDTALIAKRMTYAELEHFDPMSSAVAFSGGGMLKVKTGRVPSFSMKGETFGPYNGEVMELPICAALYLLLKRVASPA